MGEPGKLYRTEEGKIRVKVPVTYSMYDYVSMEFESVEEMKEKLNDKDFVDEMPLGDDGQYMAGSYEIDFDMLDESVGDE